MKLFYRFFSISLLVLVVASLSGCSKSKESKENSGDGGSGVIVDNITDEYLDSFGSYDDVPKHYTGHSRAIDVRPTDGVHITAEPNAFEHDTEIKMTGVSDEVYDQLDKKCEEANMKLILAYDIDAGLAQDEVMPGTYKVEFDLKKMGVPEEMWGDMACFRVTDDGQMVQYSTRMKDGKLTYESAMNTTSIIARGFKWLGKWAWESVTTPMNYVHGVFYAPLIYYMGSTVLRQYVLWPFKQYPPESTYVVSIEDEFGNFNVVYNQRLCENGSTTTAFDANGVQKDEKVERRLNELYGKAMAELNKKVDEAGKANNAGYFQSQRQRKAMREKLNHLEIYDSLCCVDKKLKELLSDEFFALPKSVEHVIRMEKLANRYLVKEQLFDKMWYTYDLYLSDNKHMKPDKSDEKSIPAEGVTIPVDGWKTIMAFRNSLIVEQKEIPKKVGKETKGKETVGTALKPEGLNQMLVTLCHESFHMQQYRYMASTFFTKDQRMCEATAIILERQFLNWLKTQKQLHPDSDIEGALTKTEGKFHWFSWTMERPIPTATNSKNAVMMIKTFLGLEDPQNTEMGYMLGEFIQYLLDTRKDV